MFAGESPQQTEKSGRKSPKSQQIVESEKTKAAPAEAVSSGGREIAPAQEVRILKQQLAAQQEQIERLRVALEEQRTMLERILQSSQPATERSPNLADVASVKPVVPATREALLASANNMPGRVPPAPQNGGAANAPAAELEIVKGELEAVADSANQTNQRLAKMEANAADTQKKVESTLGGLGGFKFSGDFRFRADLQARSGNSIALPLQNARARYRLRFNVDKELDPRFRFHLQLSTGPINNGLTNDQDFAATVVKHPFSLAEGYLDFHPNSKFSMRGGRMEEVFADNSRFLWDDDVRFNGFQQIVKLRAGSNPLGITNIELRAGEYWLTNPNVVILSTTSPYVSAGYQPGQKVRTANLFHPGLVVRSDLKTGWSHQLSTDIQLYRNPDQIQLASLADGFPVLVSNGVGLALSGPVTGTGNATTTKGGAIYSAPNFQIVRAGYRVEYKGLKLGHREMPLWFDFQGSRNVGTDSLRDAVMATANVGSVKAFGDVRFLYQFATKDANSLISQFTDDDLGTGSGVNIRVHAVRFDLGLTRFLQWQNLFFVQEPRRANNPNEQFFVPLQLGANTTFRYLGQLAFTF